MLFTFRILTALIALILGGLIYLTYRVKTLKMFRWLDNIGAHDVINSIRTNDFLQTIYLPQWVKFSLPDALWIFSYTYFTMTVWKFEITKSSAFWIFLAPIIGLFSEIGQLIGLIPGTFDFIDLIFLIAGLAIPFTQLAVMNLKKVNHEQF